MPGFPNLPLNANHTAEVHGILADHRAPSRISWARLVAPIRVALLGDVVSAECECLPLDAAVKRLLAGRSYTARYATAPNASDNDSPSKSRIAEISIVPQGSAAGEAYRLEQVANLVEEEIKDDAALLIKALKTEQAGGRLAALQKYLEGAEYADYTAVAEALSDGDSKVRGLALDAMDSADLLPTEATAEVALTDTEPKFRMDALRLLVESEGGDAQSTITRALEDPDPEVRKYAQKMAKLADSIEAFRARREPAMAKGDAGGDRPPMLGN
ncbi:MAG: HEAT repeat domain-containing protein [Gammaproteobacteria bacterium]